MQILSYTFEILEYGNIYEKLSSKTPFQHFFCPWLLVDQVLLHYNLLFIHSVAILHMVKNIELQKERGQAPERIAFITVTDSHFYS